MPLGGLGEFGMNSMAIRYGDDIIVIDAGMMFPEAELLGRRYRHAGFRLSRRTSREGPRAVLTHGHEDHIGGVPFLLSQLNMPVYGTAFTLRAGGTPAGGARTADGRLSSIASSPRTRSRLGPFEIEFIHVTHSIVSAVALAITTPLGVIIHTGDFKVDPTPTDNELFDLHTLRRVRQARRTAAAVRFDKRRSARATPKASAPCGRVSRISSTAPSSGW